MKIYPSSHKTLCRDFAQCARDTLEAGFTTKTAKKEALSDVTRAYENFTNDINRAYYTLSEPTAAQTQCYYALPPYPHQWHHADLVKAAWGDQFDISIADDLKALRDRIKVAPVQPKASAPVDDAGRMTCQICGRAIKANTGSIAHHGYQRTQWGFQTDSCPGALRLPYEAHRGVLKQQIDRLDKELRDISEEMENPLPELCLTLRDLDSPLATVTMVFTEGSFDALKTKHPRTLKGFTSFADVQALRVRNLGIRYQHLTAEYTYQGYRFEKWPGVTHTFAEGIWS